MIRSNTPRSIVNPADEICALRIRLGPSKYLHWMFTKRLCAQDARALAPDLASVLVDCVEGGASVSFMAGFSHEDACEFFESVIADVEAGKKQLYAAFVDGRLVGTVQVVLSAPPNQPHRGEIAKMLVHRDSRRMGIGADLLTAAEQGAKEAGKSLLILDTVEGGSGERLYERCGWKRVGAIPNYALFPSGEFCATVVFYKEL